MVLEVSMRGRTGLLSTTLVLVAAVGVAAPALSDLGAREKIRVIVAQDEYPEMFSFDPESAPGFEREMIEGFARLNRLDLEIVAVPRFPETIPALLAGKGDIIVGIIATDARRQRIDFTAEVIPSRHLVVTQLPRPRVETVAELRRRSVGVLAGTTWAEAAAEAGVPEANRVSFEDYDALMEALERGDIAATVMSVSDFTLSAKRNLELQAGVFLGAPGQQCWGIRKGDDELRLAINEYLTNLRNGGSWNRLVVKYFGEKALEVLGRAAQR